jgi:hypothetical protein
MGESRGACIDLKTPIHIRLSVKVGSKEVVEEQ